MTQIVNVLALCALALPGLAVADEQKEDAPRSLAGEAQYLTERSGKTGWTSGEVTFTEPQIGRASCRERV